VTIITQNIDGLHQDAGSTNVIEFHGTIAAAHCMKCCYKRKCSLEYYRNLKEFPPKCNQCDGILKPSVVLFGDSIKSGSVAASSTAVSNCTLLLVIGTSASVSPANRIPDEAVYHGAKVIEINMERTGLADKVSDMIYLEKAVALI